MKKHFKLQNYIEDEAEEDEQCSNDEDEIDENKIDTDIINVKTNLNEEKNRRKNREKFNKEQIEKEESLIKKILKRSYKAKTKENNLKTLFKRKNNDWLNINQRALVLSQSTSNESKSPARIKQKIRVGFKCHRNEKENDNILEIKSSENGTEDIDELKNKVEKKIKEKISETSSDYKKKFNERIKDNKRILENVIQLNEEKKNIIKKKGINNPFGIPNKHTSLLQDIKDNKYNISQTIGKKNETNIGTINQFFLHSKTVSTNNSLSTLIKIKINTIFN